MTKIDEPTFNGEVSRIQREYGSDRAWEADQAGHFAYHLYWQRRELDREEDASDLDRILQRMIVRSQTNKYLWDAVNLVAQAHLTRGDSLPEPLAEWIELVLVDQHLQRSEKFQPRPRTGAMVWQYALGSCAWRSRTWLRGDTRRLGWAETTWRPPMEDPRAT